MRDGVEDEGNWPLSKQRTGTSAQTETTPVAEVMAWDCIDGSQPRSIIGRKEFGLSVATWWMLREIDAAGLLMNSVVTGARGAMVIKFALQKMMPVARVRSSSWSVFAVVRLGSAGVPLAISRNNTRR